MYDGGGVSASSRTHTRTHQTRRRHTGAMQRLTTTPARTTVLTGCNTPLSLRMFRMWHDGKFRGNRRGNYNAPEVFAHPSMHRRRQPRSQPQRLHRRHCPLSPEIGNCHTDGTCHITPRQGTWRPKPHPQRRTQRAAKRRAVTRQGASLKGGKPVHSRFCVTRPIINVRQATRRLPAVLILEDGSTTEPNPSPHRCTRQPLRRQQSLQGF